jgi:hypothetical protein
MKKKQGPLTFGLMTKAMDALEIVIKHVGIAACPECLLPEQRLCPDTWFHKPTGTCNACEEIYEIIDEHKCDCPATALTRLSQACKYIAEARHPAEVQTHVNTKQLRKHQFRDLEHVDF